MGGLDPLVVVAIVGALSALSTALLMNVVLPLIQRWRGKPERAAGSKKLEAEAADILTGRALDLVEKLQGQLDRQDRRLFLVQNANAAQALEIATIQAINVTLAEEVMHLKADLVDVRAELSQMRKHNDVLQEQNRRLQSSLADAANL